MITWLQAWPLMAAPFVLISLLAALPTITFQSRTLGGLSFRQWFLDHFLLPVIPSMFEDRVLNWFSSAGTLDEWLLVALVALNINAILLPALYFLVDSFISFSAWITRKSLDLKSNAVR